VAAASSARLKRLPLGRLGVIMSIIIDQYSTKKSIKNGIYGFVFGMVIQLLLSSQLTTIIYLALIGIQSYFGNTQFSIIIYKILLSMLISIGIMNHNICTALSCSLWMENYVRYLEAIIVGVIGYFCFLNAKNKIGFVHFGVIYFIYIAIMSIPIYIFLFSGK
jgi:hypothetical protein